MHARCVCLLLLALLVFSGKVSVAQSSDFTIIALPDTQNEAQFFPEVLEDQTKWIVAHRAQLNIQMVLGEGDIVNDFSSPAQRASADEAFRILDSAGLPYMLAIGNHDYDDANPKAGRPVNGFNRLFGPARYAGKPYYRGNLDGSNENFYGVVNIGGTEFLFLILEFVPRPSSMAWAESILRANPDKEVIVVTHSFIYVDDTRVDICDTRDMPRSNETGEDMWAQLRTFPNVIMVVSGHLTNGQAARRADLGDQGNLVNQVFANFQTFPHGGDGWLRIMTFHPAANSITVQTYSPSLNKFKTDERNQFTLFFHNPHLSSGAGMLSGLVRDFMTCKPMAGVSVSVAGKSAITDAKGHYSVTLAPGQYAVTANAEGEDPQVKNETVNDSFDTDLNFYFGGPTVPSNPPVPTAPLIMGVTPTSAQITLGESADFMLNLSSNGSLTEPVALSCGNLPAGTRCAFDRKQIEIKEMPVTVKLTISTTALASSMKGGRRDVGRLAGVGIALGAVLLGVVLGGGRGRKIYCGAVMLVLIVGCRGVIAPENRGSFTATVISMSGKVQQTSQIELTLR
jgi:hypothetical protein